MSLWQHWHGLLVSCAAAGVVGLASVSPATAVEKSEDGRRSQKDAVSCAPPVIRDYERVLRRLPPITARPRKNGSLPFGPRGIFVHELRRRIYVPGDADGQKVRFELLPDTPGGRVFNLDWIVKGRVRAIDRRGRSRGTVDRAKWKFGRVGAAKLLQTVFGLRIPPRPGIYRAELTFDRGTTGRRIGRIAQYLRVVKPRVDARLRVIGDEVVPPGGVAHVQVENLGTRELLDGNSYELMREEGGAWVPARDDANVGPAISIGSRSIYGGLSGSCERVPIPSDAAAGRYRVSRLVVVGSNRRILHLSGTVRVG